MPTGGTLWGSVYRLWSWTTGWNYPPFALMTPGLAFTESVMATTNGNEVLAKLAPGTRIKLTVASIPASEGARKTLVRLLSKDDDAKIEDARLRQVRKANAVINQRGGRIRLWAGRVVKQHPVKGKLGETGTITASVDVLRDLRSVARFVNIESV